MMSAEDEQLVCLGRGLSGMLGSGEWLLLTVRILLEPCAFLALQFHDVDLWVWLDLAVLAVFNTTVKKVVLGAHPVEGVAGPRRGLIAGLRELLPFVS